MVPRVLACIAVGVAALGLACDGSTDRTSGPVCAVCVQNDGSSFNGASMIEPTPCQMSEVASPIDLPGARAAGFGGALDLVEREFDSPFQWTASDPVQFGSPARGYTPTTTAHVKTTIASIDHLVPSLAGCQDRLAVTLDVSFATATAPSRSGARSSPRSITARCRPWDSGRSTWRAPSGR
jgi:hypothetical protein